MLRTHLKKWITSLAVTSVLAAASSAWAQEDIVLGGSIPLTGVFAFAGIGIDAGIKDYLKIVNDAGGVKGRKLRYVPEDTGYKVDASMAAFKKITSQNKVSLYYADSTGFSKTVNPELERSGAMLMTGASFGKELNDPKKYPLQFMVGPDYSEMVGILLNYIAKAKPGAKVAIVYSDTEFGRDPIEAARTSIKKLGLNLVTEIVTAPGSVDVSSEVIKLRRADPDYTIFHGYILAPIPEFVTQAKALGMKTAFMGTFWSMDNSTVMKMGDSADGFMGVMPYRYYYDTDGKSPMLEKIRQLHPEYQSTAYTQGFLSAMLMTEAVKRTLDAGKPLDGKNMKAALNSIANFDTGGLIGTPITIKGNSIPVGRIYKADMKQKKMLPVSDWITLEQ
ncbi:ABC transporter substrate-binding protein [Actimicrobium sp. CCC2.4]|uniref:ABC transporter substrate-binding protein n=1 Tax=Actimicrobium sp. CCC2.4 TaxID=3048606 RepID=UPI002AC99DAA|nr:ABC transporter substrate-binding protein [Actimicrobium sp. CCC2.4]MEB0133959.1 ABC transporter substrate-binding protein [Actimicrobium sp. CCC2.4]WPX31497.1 ABC transporter substrate-binding protein [Actimicrobium sp. CCC2.4]